MASAEERRERVIAQLRGLENKLAAAAAAIPAMARDVRELRELAEGKAPAAREGEPDAGNQEE